MSKKIKSQLTLIRRSDTDIYNFLADFNNFSHLMPEQVINWQSDSEHCSFEIKGLATLGLSYLEKTPSNKLVMKGEGRLPFDFTLISYLSALDETSCNVELAIEADMNPFISMMAEKPLTNFVNELVTRLKQEMETPGKI